MWFCTSNLNNCQSLTAVSFNFVAFLSTDPPTITYISGNKTVNDTNTVSLICTADGNPTPSITWTKSSNVVPSRFNISGRDSGGNYTCIAVNGIGSSDSMVLFITVESKF